MGLNPKKKKGERMKQLQKGRWVRILGKVTIRKGGSEWTVKNPKILLGKCRHILKKVVWWKNPLTGNRVYTYGDGRVECTECGCVTKKKVKER